MERTKPRAPQRACRIPFRKVKVKVCFYTYEENVSDKLSADRDVNLATSSDQSLELDGRSCEDVDNGLDRHFKGVLRACVHSQASWERISFNVFPLGKTKHTQNINVHLDISLNIDENGGAGGVTAGLDGDTRNGEIGERDGETASSDLSVGLEGSSEDRGDESERCSSDGEDAESTHYDYMKGV